MVHGQRIILSHLCFEVENNKYGKHRKWIAQLIQLEALELSGGLKGLFDQIAIVRNVQQSLLRSQPFLPSVPSEFVIQVGRDSLHWILQTSRIMRKVLAIKSGLL